MARIEFENVDLEYPIRENYGITLKEIVVQGVHRLLGKKKTAAEGLKDSRDFKALDAVSFEIHDGERVGIVGLNGAGKSTLLRTIGGIFPIKRGRRRVEGSICGLFDLGVGFEGEATGWQNIYYRSYLQGETPGSVKEKLQEIAEFTELNEFLELPLRCYSAGMQMRLAFAIATSRNPEILLIDEVFGTGDLIFQKKAEQRMRDFMHKARIVVMVGHHLEFLQEFCTRIIWLDHGKIHAVGPTREMIHAYTQQASHLQQQAA